MGNLKPREREILWLAYAEGASYKEIAGVLGLRAPSVRVLLFRARQKMLKLLRRPRLPLMTQVDTRDQS
jgi:RNA polymerase sigma-70 factor (ECF subfamily)